MRTDSIAFTLLQVEWPQQIAQIAGYGDGDLIFPGAAQRGNIQCVGMPQDGAGIPAVHLHLRHRGAQLRKAKLRRGGLLGGQVDAAAEGHAAGEERKSLRRQCAVGHSLRPGIQHKAAVGAQTAALQCGEGGVCVYAKVALQINSFDLHIIGELVLLGFKVQGFLQAFAGGGALVKGAGQANGVFALLHVGIDVDAPEGAVKVVSAVGHLHRLAVHRHGEELRCFQYQLTAGKGLVPYRKVVGYSCFHRPAESAGLFLYIADRQRPVGCLPVKGHIAYIQCQGIVVGRRQPPFSPQLGGDGQSRLFCRLCTGGCRRVVVDEYHGAAVFRQRQRHGHLSLGCMEDRRHLLAGHSIKQAGTAAGCRQRDRVGGGTGVAQVNHGHAPVGKAAGGGQYIVLFVVAGVGEGDRPQPGRDGLMHLPVRCRGAALRQRLPLGGGRPAVDQRGLLLGEQQRTALRLELLQQLVGAVAKAFCRRHNDQPIALAAYDQPAALHACVAGEDAPIPQVVGDLVGLQRLHRFQHVFTAGVGGCAIFHMQPAAFHRVQHQDLGFHSALGQQHADAADHIVEQAVVPPPRLLLE